jgi:hypothetical protein
MCFESKMVAEPCLSIFCIISCKFNWNGYGEKNSYFETYHVFSSTYVFSKIFILCFLFRIDLASDLVRADQPVRDPPDLQDRAEEGRSSKACTITEKEFIPELSQVTFLFSELVLNVNTN